MRVILVDDDRTTRLLLASILRQRELDVSCFDAGEPAVDALLECAFDLAVLDWMLPGMSGIELCRWIRSQPWGEGVYIIILTACSQAADLQEALEAGANDFLSKPIDPDMLLQRLQIATRLLSIRQQLSQIS
jgi:DNA-binding response OmpR family regulator